MTPLESLKLVYELAEQNAIDKESAEDMGVLDQYERQQEALDVVLVMITYSIANGDK